MALDSRLALLSQTPDLLGGFIQGVEKGDKLRQFVDGRRKDRLMNQLMRLSDPEAQREMARNSPFAADMLGALDAKEAERRKAALENMKTNSEIGKIDSEAYKNNADGGKTQFETATGRSAALSGAAMGAASGADPMIGMATNIMKLASTGVIDQGMAENIVRLIPKDPRAASQIIESMARSNPEIAKMMQSEQVSINAGGHTAYGAFNPNTGATMINGREAFTQSPDNQADNLTRQYVSDNSTQASMYGDDLGLQGRMYSADMGYQGRMDAAAMGGQGQAPMPTSALKMINELNSDIGSTTSTNGRIQETITALDTGQLQLGPMRNVFNKMRNGLGLSNEESQQYERMTSNIHAMANEVLLQANGVQTEGDAQRAYNTIISSNFSDPQVVKQALQQLKAINEKTLEIKRANLNGIYQNYGQAPQGQMQQQSQQGGMIAPQSTVAQLASEMGLSPQEAAQILSQNGYTIQ